ncbi:lipopolysaccharide biosynthesis protein [Silvibacterium acidisoli]|uniref:lipopolysaccharide biosynthesis protein n=1 Tax=Acidobacteriaceae bacterium ZG23-2 TaxID=2883246 RepID=UPI00406CE518
MPAVNLQNPTGESRTRVYGRNVVISSMRLFVMAASGLALPAFLTHHLPPSTYSAWVLILQVAGYVSYLEFGVTTAISKYVAEHAAANDMEACNRHASAGVTITCVSGVIGVLISILLAFSVPTLFHDIPATLVSDVSRGIFLVGTSLAILLAATAFGGIFMGLQRFALPMSLITLNKLVYVIVVLIAVARHLSLTEMGAAVAIVNVLTAIAVVVAWKLMIPEVQVHPRLVISATVRKMLGYCAVLGIWTSGMLLINGLDTTIVGHFDFRRTAFYAVAATPSSFLTLALQAVLGPLMPAVSAASIDHTPRQMGDLLDKSSRQSFILAQLSGLPFLLFAYWILSIWVGHTYAENGYMLMRILITANILRLFFGPYTTMVIATGLQKYATLSGVCEAVVNLIFSIWLGKHYGALGVACGTLIGALVGICVHFSVSVPKTNGTFAITPLRLLLSGMLRPGVASLPTVALLFLYWSPNDHNRGSAFLAASTIAWAIATLLLAWQFGLLKAERLRLVKALAARTHGRAVTSEL